VIRQDGIIEEQGVVEEQDGLGCRCGVARCGCDGGVRRDEHGHGNHDRGLISTRTLWSNDGHKSLDLGRDLGREGS